MILKNRTYGLLLIALILVFPSSVSAHSFGQPPYFKVNGVYSNLYPVPTTSLEDFNLPQDQTPDKYLVNVPINFEVDTARMSVPADIVAKTKFTWDFGDGATATGLTENHAYTKIGSYILSIHAQDSTVPTPQLLETAELNIVPSKDYQLPQAIIKVNNQQSKDPLTDILNFKLDQSISFDGSLSNSPSGKIVSYTWDFGDQKSGDQVKMTHTYSDDLSQVFPVLRITDDQGFFADSFVEIKNNNQSIANPTIVPTGQSGNKPASKSNGFVVILGLGITLGLGIWFIFKKKLSRR